MAAYLLQCQYFLLRQGETTDGLIALYVDFFIILIINYAEMPFICHSLQTGRPRLASALNS